MRFDKFSLPESLNDSKGKSSLGLLFGLLYGVGALIMYGFGVAMVFMGINGYNDVFIHAGILTGASGTLIGSRYFKKDKDLTLKNEEIKEENI